MTHDCTALLAMPVTDRPEAEAFITALHTAGLMHHFDDGAVDCLHGNGLVTRADADQIEARVALCYVAWEASGADLYVDCPIGHALKVMALSDAIATDDLDAALEPFQTAHGIDDGGTASIFFDGPNEDAWRTGGAAERSTLLAQYLAFDATFALASA